MASFGLGSGVVVGMAAPVEGRRVPSDSAALELACIISYVVRVVSRPLE